MALNLDSLEKRLAKLIEVHLPQYLPLRKPDNKVAQQLVEAMQTHLKIRDGKEIAPNHYTILAHPLLLAKWQEDATLISSFKAMMLMLAEETSVEFDAPPILSFASDPELGRDEIKILVSKQMDTIADTQGMKNEAKENTEQVPKSAFFIIGGTKVFPLEQAVLNVGRRMENDLVIDDPRVSRNHAQLRAVNGRFVIFDLNSTGGTYVNSQRSHQSVLYPGDVISLAGVPLIYGQDNPPHRSDVEQTSPFDPYSASTERPTVLLRETAKFEDTPDPQKDE